MIIGRKIKLMDLIICPCCLETFKVEHKLVLQDAINAVNPEEKEEEVELQCPWCGETNTMKDLLSGQCVAEQYWVEEVKDEV